MHSKVIELMLREVRIEVHILAMEFTVYAGSQLLFPTVRQLSIKELRLKCYSNTYSWCIVGYRLDCKPFCWKSNTRPDCSAPPIAHHTTQMATLFSTRSGSRNVYGIFGVLVRNLFLR